jgi:hypothetical protein
MMKELGLVRVRAEGNVRIYALEAKFLEGMNKDIFSQQNLATLVYNTAADDQEQKVLQTFLDGERVKAIPAQYEKKLVLLKWMAAKFESGVRYPEPEVNGIIKQYHPDSAWFRRWLVDQKFMAREKGVYWRLPEPANPDKQD